jgi:hypothetical protein
MFRLLGFLMKWGAVIAVGLVIYSSFTGYLKNLYDWMEP